MKSWSFWKVRWIIWLMDLSIKPCVLLQPTHILSNNSTRKLKQRTHYTYTQLPSIIQFEKSELGKTNVPGYVLYAQILTRLEFLLNLFLLERLLKRHHIVTEQDLVEVSHEMLDLTLIFWKKKDRFVGLYADFEWLVRIAGPLCLCVNVDYLSNTTIRPCHTLFQPAASSVCSCCDKPSIRIAIRHASHDRQSFRTLVCWYCVWTGLRRRLLAGAWYLSSEGSWVDLWTGYWMLIRQGLSSYNLSGRFQVMGFCNTRI